MADPSWTDYIGAMTGVVGMVTGISGAVLGYIGYRRSNQNKALDMRLALRKDLAEARKLIPTLRELMASASGSRRATLAASGLSKSRAVDVWEEALESDRVEVEKIAASILSEGADFAALSVEQLESETVAVHVIKTSLSTLVEKYRGEIAANDEVRRQIGQQNIAMAAARMGQQATKPLR